MKPSIQAFIDEYLIDHNGAEAARRAGYAESSAKQRAHVLLNRPEVISAIGECHAERRVRDGLHVHEIVTDLSIIARTAPSIAQRLRAYTLVMRYYGMLSGKRHPTDDDSHAFLGNRIFRMQNGLKLAGKPFHDDVEEEEPLDLESLELLIQDDLAADAEAHEPQPQSADTAPTPSDPDPNDKPGPDSHSATNPKPNSPPPEPSDPDRHRKGPNRGGPAPAKSAPDGSVPAKPAPVKPAPATSAPMRSSPAPSAPVQPTRSAPHRQLPGVKPPRPRRRPDPMHAYIQSVNDPALTEVWAAISGTLDSDEKR